jgi:hypothetical protein
MRVCLVDLDETLGGFAALVYTLHYVYVAAGMRDNLGQIVVWNSVHKAALVSWLRVQFGRKYLRPGTVDFLHELGQCKASGQFSHVVLFTMSPNSVGWVSLVMEVLNTLVRERFDTAADTFDALVTVDDVENWHPTHSCPLPLREEFTAEGVPPIRKTIKWVDAVAAKLKLDMNTVQFVAVDDFPQLVRQSAGGSVDVVAITPYVVLDPDIKTLFEELKSLLPADTLEDRFTADVFEEMFGATASLSRDFVKFGVVVPRVSSLEAALAELKSVV